MLCIKSLSRKRKVCAVTLLVLLVLNMGLIFFLSSEDATASSDRSNPIAGAVVDAGEQHAGNQRPMIPEEKQNAVANMQFVIREMAHFLEYAPLGLLACALLVTVKTRPWLLAGGLSVGFGLLYAISDELHQRFVPGRSGSWRDVAIDTLGVVCGVCVALATLKMIELVRAARRKRHAVDAV